MSVRRHISRIALVLAFSAAAVPAAQAGSPLVDDYFRDPPLAQTSGPLVDDWFRDPVASQPSELYVDDYFRDAPAASPAEIMVDDYFRDAPTTASPADIVVDDYFRDAATTPVLVSSPSDGFDWGDFGIGAATSLGALLMLVGLGAGAMAVRQRGEKTGPAATL